MLLRGIAHGRDAHATYKHMHLITCNATYGAGGLGHLLADTVERARASGRAFRYVVGGLRAGDEAIGTVVRSRLAPLLNRLPPMRFDPGRRQWITFECFDRAAAKRIPPGVESVLAFAGQALHTFRAARRAGAGVRLELLSPTAHINHVWRQHRKAATQHPIERDWLSARHREKVLVEYETTDVILVLSDYARKTFLDAGIAAERLQRIDVTAKQRFHGAQREPSDGVFRIVYTGALTVTKGVPLLIEAFERLATRDAELILVGGSGSRGMRKFLQRAIARDGRIRIAPGDPLPHLRRADVYVHPSYQDGYAYAVAEALACGVPVIVTEDTGAKEHVIEGVNGWIVPTGDADAIHDRLRQLLASNPSPARARACAS